MFDLSWSHIGLFVVIALLVLGPKELPNAIRTGAQLLRAGRKLAGEFRGGLDELMREAELDETRRSIKQAMTEGLDKTIGEHVDPAGEIKSGLENPVIETTAPAELSGPPSPASSNMVINDPPPAPPNSIVPPPAEEAASEAAPSEEPQSEALSVTSPPASAPSDSSMPSAPEPAPGAASEAATEDLKKTA
jgi:sec-independent protein translocase protein TatB